MATRRGWLLLFLGVDGGTHGTDQIRVMKGPFLLSQTAGQPVQNLYRFEPYDFGPFDSSVYRDLDALQLEGPVDVEARLGSSRKTYRLTEAGKERFVALVPTVADIDAEELALIRAAKHRVTSLDFDELLAQIYEEYPSYAVQSIAQVAPRGR